MMIFSAASKASLRILAVVAAAFLAMTTFAAPAFAHNVEISSDPADGAVLDSAPTAVSFTFDQPIENFDPVLRVFGPKGNVFTTDAPTVTDTVISAPFEAGPAGDYRAVYRIVSADGHPVTGESTFTLTDAAAGDATGSAPTESASAPATDSAANSTDSGSDSSTQRTVWIWTGVGFAIVLVIGAIAIAVRKPKFPPEGPQPPQKPAGPETEADAAPDEN